MKYRKLLLLLGKQHKCFPPGCLPGGLVSLRVASRLKTSGQDHARSFLLEGGELRWKSENFFKSGFVKFGLCFGY